MATIEAPITERQIDLLVALVERAGSVKEAARSASMSYGTAKSHLAAARSKTGLSWQQLVYIGARDGWLRIRRFDRPHRPVGR